MSNYDPHALNWLDEARDTTGSNALGLVLIRTYQNDGFGQLLAFVGWAVRKGHLPEQLPTTRPLPLPPGEGEAIAATWLQSTITTDPELAEIVGEAMETSYRPLLRFASWTAENGLLNVRIPQNGEVPQ